MSSFRTDIYAGNSGITSNTGAFVGDAKELTAFLDIDSATTVVLQGSNATGFRETIAEDDWSTMTTMAVISTNQLVNIEPGFRWFRALRETASAASLAQLVLAGRNDDHS